MYVDMFENDLLKKLPMHVNHQMVGRMPLIKETSLFSTYSDFTNESVIGLT